MSKTLLRFTCHLRCRAEKKLSNSSEWYASSSRYSLAKHSLDSIVNPDDRGPMMEYDDRVNAGRLRDDEHQRGQQDAPHYQFLD
jgi:hypothetical protein